MDRYFENEHFTKVDVLEFSEGEYIGCHFTGMDLTTSSFKSGKFIDCVFKECNLSNIELLNAACSNLSFADCKLVGTNWTTTNRISGLQFTSCLLDFAVMQDLELENMKFENCSLKDCDFSGANLKGSEFKGSNLENAIFNQCNLQNASFVNAQHYFIDPRDNKLKGAKFSMPEAITLFEALGIEIFF